MERDTAKMVSAIGPSDGKRHWIDWNGTERGTHFLEDYLGDCRRWLAARGGDIADRRKRIRRELDKDSTAIALMWEWRGDVLHVWTYGRG